MSEAKFACPSCQRSFRWKPELAGRTAKCKCGQVIQVPAQAPAAREQSSSDLLSGTSSGGGGQSELDKIAAAAWSDATPGGGGGGGADAGGFDLDEPAGPPQHAPRRRSSGRAQAMHQTNLASDAFGCQMAAVSLGALILAMGLGVVMQMNRRGGGEMMPILLEVLRLACFGLATAIAVGRGLFAGAVVCEAIGFGLLLMLMNATSRPSEAMIYMAIALPPIASILYFCGLLTVGLRLSNGVIVACSGICAAIAAIILIMTFGAISGGGGRTLQQFMPIAGWILIGMVITLLVMFIKSSADLKNKQAYGAEEPEWG